MLPKHATPPFQTADRLYKYERLVLVFVPTQ